jgi:hypothetical protein
VFAHASTLRLVSRVFTFPFLSYLKPTFLTKESYVVARLFVFLSVCLSVSDLKLFNQFVDFHKIQQGGYAIEDDLEAMIFIP